MSIDDDALHFHVELEVHDGTLDGELSDDQGRPVTFAGWLGLVEAIEAAVRRGGRVARALSEGRPGRPPEDAP